MPAACVGTPDADGDGHDSLACGGNDCDDDDPNRYGGNSEVCDAEGRDEDCIADTVGDRDADGDGFVDALCCNGTECGPDCDDSLADVRPGVAELCNGRDDDCDGVTDEAGAEPLCPGGTCAGGRCSLSAWDHTFNADDPRLAMDSAGNVYVAARFGGTVAFDGGPLTATDGEDDVLVAYDADGTHRWDLHAGGTTTVQGLFATASSLFIAGVFSDSLELGSFSMARSGLHLFVAEIAAMDGAVSRHAVFASQAAVAGLSVSPSAVHVVGYPTAASAEIAGTPLGDGSFLLSLDASDLRFRSVDAWEGAVSVRGVARRPGGGFVFASAGFGSVDLGCVPVSGAADRDTAFVAAFDAGGACEWVYSLDGTLDFWDVATDELDNVFVAVQFFDSYDFGGGTREAGAGSNGAIVALDGAGVYRWDRVFGSPNGRLLGVDDSSSGVVAVGGFETQITIGGSTLAGSSLGDSVLVELSPTGSVRRTRTFMSDNFDGASDVIVGRGDSTVVVGRFTGALTLGTGTFLGPGVYVTRLPSG